MSNSVYLVALGLGIFSTIHCFGMCGGIVGALSMTIPAEIRQNRWRFTTIVAAYNLGRITTYTILGFIAGQVSSLMIDQLFIESGQRVLQIIAGIVLTGIGLNMSGLVPFSNRLEAAGYAVWTFIRPIGQYFFPVTNAYRGYASGFIWGMLPCALVYSALISSISMADVYKSTAVMFFFGLGTLPGMIFAGTVGGSINKRFHSSTIRYIASSLVIALGIYSLSTALISGTMSNHNHHIH